MALALDPTCPDARILADIHDRRGVVANGLSGSRLSRVVTQQRNAAYAAHAESCGRCQSYMRRCPRCQVDLGIEQHKFFCAQNKGRWRALFDDERAPPLAALVDTDVLPTRGAVAGAARAPARPRPTAPVARPRAPAPHDVLGVRPGASAEQVRAAYRELALQYHPDRVAYLAPEFRQVAEEKMRVINAAYQALSG